ncbi:MAG: hypothetical protein ACFBSC_05840 [Microcoleaceae cyanobacterium]
MDNEFGEFTSEGFDFVGVDLGEADSVNSRSQGNPNFESVAINHSDADADIKSQKSQGKSKGNGEEKREKIENCSKGSMN